MTWHEILFIAAFILIAGGALLFDYYSRKLKVGTVHSSLKMCRAMEAEIARILPQLDHDEPLIVDPGCGTGKLARHIARKFPHTRVVGLELFPPAYLWGRMMTALRGPDNFWIMRQDFYAFDFSKADVVVAFLPAPVFHTLKNKFEDELGANSFVLSNAFFMEGWEAYDAPLIEKLLKRRLFCYRMGDQKHAHHDHAPKQGVTEQP